MPKPDDSPTNGERSTIITAHELPVQPSDDRVLVERARALGQLIELSEMLGLSQDTSHEFLVAFRIRMQGADFDLVQELGRTFSNIVALLPKKNDGSGLSFVEINEAGYGIGFETALQYLEALTGRAYANFNPQKASELTSIIMNFLTIKIRKDNPDREKILLGILSGLPNVEIAERLGVTVNLVTHQKAYMLKKVSENPRRHILHQRVERVLSEYEITHRRQLTLFEDDEIMTESDPIMANDEVSVEQPPTKPLITSEIDVDVEDPLIESFAKTLDIDQDLRASLRNFLSIDSGSSLLITGEQKHKIVQRFRAMIKKYFKSFHNASIQLNEQEKMAVSHTLGWLHQDGKDLYFPGMLISVYTHIENDGRTQEREELSVNAYTKLAAAFERTRPRPTTGSVAK